MIAPNTPNNIFALINGKFRWKICNGSTEPAQNRRRMRGIRGFHVQRPVWSPVVVKADPVANDTTGMLQRFKVVPLSTLFLQKFL